MAAGFSTAISAGASAALDALGSLDKHQAKDSNSKIAGAAKDFESLLIGQILKSAHSEGGWLGSGDDDASDAAIGLGEEQLARTMSANGGLGLAKMISAGLQRQQTPASTPTPTEE